MNKTLFHDMALRPFYLQNAGDLRRQHFLFKYPISIINNMLNEKIYMEEQ
ncbi:hypothetical protein [Chitinophaga sp. 212800008-4]